MKFSLKETILFSLRYPFENSQALMQAILYSAAGLASIQLLIMIIVSWIQGLPFDDFAVKSEALGTLYAISIPLSELLLIPLSIAVILHLFKGRTFENDFISWDMGMLAVWYLAASMIYLGLFAFPQLAYHVINGFFPRAEFMIYILFGLPALAASIFFLLTIVFLPMRTILGEKIDIVANIELTKNYLFPIFLVVAIMLIGMSAIRIPMHVVFSMIFSAFPAVINIIVSTIALALLDILFILILNAAICHLYASISGTKLKGK